MYSTFLYNKADYNGKIMEILNDYTKFEKVKDNTLATILRCEDKLNRFLRKLKSDDVISGELYRNLFASGSQPGVMYGLPKVHKPQCPLRPILSAMNTHNYGISKFLVPILAPYTINQYSVKDSFTFVRELGGLNIRNGVMASFDVKSLFTNIPIQETLNICLNKLYENNDVVLSFNKAQMKNLLSLAVHDCYFIFNGETFKQIDGVAMGSPLSASLANIFLAHHEVGWLDNCPPEFKPIMYRRYVDDTFVIFESEEHVPLFQDYLNSQHRNMQFTSEIETENKLPFLDILIEKQGGSFQTSVYRKPTFTGLTTKFTSAIPAQYKQNLILTLVNRAYSICSNYLSLHKELLSLKKTLLSNEFTSRMINKCIGKQLNKLHQTARPQISTADRAIVYFPILFSGKESFNIRNKMIKLMKEFYPQVNVRVIFRTKNAIQNWFRIKDKIPLDLQSSLVYHYECGVCNSSYVGKTSRHFSARIAEHRGVSHRTGQPLSKPPFSAIRDHSVAKDHPISKGGFSILGSQQTDMDLRVLESLYTYKLKPDMGNNESSVDLLCF